MARGEPDVRTMRNAKKGAMWIALLVVVGCSSSDGEGVVGGGGMNIGGLGDWEGVDAVKEVARPHGDAHVGAVAAWGEWDCRAVDYGRVPGADIVR